MKRANLDHDGDDNWGKMVKMETGRRFVGCGSGTPLPELPDDLVVEIIRRLPGNELQKSVCLSKALRSTILDPSFMGAYLKSYFSRNNAGHTGRGLLAVFNEAHLDGMTLTLREMCFYFSPLLLFDDTEDDAAAPPPPSFRSIFEMPSSFLVSYSNLSLIGITKVVRGLVCAYSANRVMVCNICTGQSMWLPDSSLSGSSTMSELSYHFGYDPVKRVYKLLKVSVTKVEFVIAKKAQILTLGRDSSWRNLDMCYGQLSGLGADSYLCKGALYWVPSGIDMVSFNLNTEKAQFIRLPPSPAFTSSRCWFVSQFKGRPVVGLARVNGDKGKGEGLILYALNYHVGNDGLSYWSKYAMSYPPGVVNLIPVGNLPTGHILLVDSLALDCESLDSCLPVYACDPHKENNNFERFVIGYIPRLAVSSFHSFRISYIDLKEENIETLDVLFGKHL